MTTGPLGAGYTYASAAHKHAVTSVTGGGATLTYDANGNKVNRTVGGQSSALDTGG
jgi:hypothetical protein